MIKDFNLDKESHIYTFKNIKQPHVTGVIKDNFGTPIWYDDWHRERGIAIHRAIHLYILGTLDWNSLDERIKGRLKAFIKFINETNLKILWSELSLFSKRYQFAGTIDVIAEDHINRLHTIDIKSSLEEVVIFQLGGYDILWDENYSRKIQRSCAVLLKDNDDYNIAWYNDIKKAKRLFLASLTISNWLNE